MSAHRGRPRPPRIAASLAERRNDLRPLAPLTERLLQGLGAHPSFAESVLGDLAEERARREKEQGVLRARSWYALEAGRAVPHLIWNAVRHGGATGRARVAALLVGPALVIGLVSAFVMRDRPPAFLVFEGQRGSDIVNGVVLNTRHPVQLVTHAFDARKRELPSTDIRYEWMTGVPVSVTRNGVVTCTEPGDAEVRAWVGTLATRLLIRCRPVSRVNGDMVLSLIAGDKEEALRFAAFAANGRREWLVAYDARAEDTSVVALNGLLIRPVAPGTTSVVVRVGDGQTRIFVTVYERVRTLAGLRPEQRLVSVPVRLSASDTIGWPLPTGRFWLRFTPLRPSRPAPKITVSGDIACTPDFGPTDQASCVVGARGARVRITHSGKSRDPIAGNLSLERHGPD